MDEFRIRGLLQYSNDYGKTWFILNNGHHIELTNTSVAFDVEDKGISVRGTVIKK